MRSSASPSSKPGDSAVKRLWPIAALLVVVVSLFVFGPDNAVILETVRKHRGAILAFVADNAALAGAVYMAGYALAIAFSVPGGAMMTIAGGFLFGWWLATVYVVFAATVGATALFLVARGAVGNRFRTRAGPWMAKMETGFQENALSYLLILRLVPVFPFWLVNLVPAFLGVSLRTYIVGTLFGIIPGSIVYSSVGNGLGAVLDAGGTPDVGVIFEPEIILPLVGLAVLASIPIAYKRFKAARP